MNAAAILLMTAWLAGTGPGQAETLPPPSAGTVVPTKPGLSATPVPTEQTMPTETAPIAADPSFSSGGGYGGGCSTGCACCGFRSWFSRLFARLFFWRRIHSCTNFGSCQSCGCGDAGNNSFAPAVSASGPACGSGSCPGAAAIMPREAKAAPRKAPLVDLAGFFEKDTKPAAGPAGKLTVALPAGASLFIDGQAVTVRAGETTFRTPLLDEMEVYYYELRAERTHNGRTVSETTRVMVRPGQESWVCFPRLERLMAEQPAKTAEH